MNMNRREFLFFLRKQIAITTGGGSTTQDKATEKGTLNLSGSEIHCVTKITLL